jgi:hypothetical protein
LVFEAFSKLSMFFLLFLFTSVNLFFFQRFLALYFPSVFSFLVLYFCLFPFYVLFTCFFPALLSSFFRGCVLPLETDPAWPKNLRELPVNHNVSFTLYKSIEFDNGTNTSPQTIPAAENAPLPIQISAWWFLARAYDPRSVCTGSKVIVQGNFDTSKKYKCFFEMGYRYMDPDSVWLAPSNASQLICEFPLQTATGFGRAERCEGQTSFPLQFF